MSVVLVGGLDEYLIAVARELVTRGVPVTHFLDRYQRPESREGVLANVTSIDTREFMDPVKIRQLNRAQKPVVDAVLLQSFASAQLVWLAVSDRYTHTLSVLERQRLFRELLDYFYRWLRTEPIQTIVFPNVPHAGWNNVLYAVAKHLGVHTIILEATRLNDRVVLWDDYEAINKVPSDFMAGASQDVVEQHIDPELWKELSTNSSWMVLSDDINRASLQRSAAVGEVVSLIRALVVGLVKSQRPRDLQFDVPWSWWSAHWRRYQLQRRARQLRGLYESLVTRTIPTTPYVLFFLNYQPEKTTTPMGGVFDDQLLAVRLLSAALPSDWQIMVKEHPRQFGAHVDASRFRSAEFYEELAAMPNVQLVHPAAATTSLLASCQATATITGSIGWQGLQQGKASLNFGRSWYAGCRSCYVVTSVADIKTAITDIQSKSSADVQLDVLKFLAYERTNFVIGSNADSYVARSQRSPQQLAESLAHALAERINVRLKSPVVNDVIKAGV